MIRTKTIASVLSVVLLGGLPAMAEGPGEQQGSQRNQAIPLVGAQDAAAEADLEAVASTEGEQRDAVVPIYVPASRGSTLVQDDSGIQGARRPGVRL